MRNALRLKFEANRHETDPKLIDKQKEAAYSGLNNIFKMMVAREIQQQPSEAPDISSPTEDESKTTTMDSSRPGKSNDAPVRRRFKYSTK